METLGERMVWAARQNWGNDGPIAELSRQTGLSVQMLSKTKNSGTHNPQPANFLKICDALGVNPHWLARGEGPIWKEREGLTQSDREWLALGQQLSDAQRQAAKALFDRADQREHSANDD